MAKETPAISTIRITHAALDEQPDGSVVLRGVIDPKSLPLVQVDDYQREPLPPTSLTSLIEAIKGRQKVPDLALGMRGGNFSDSRGVYLLHDPLFVIDGLQRISTALHLMRTGEQPDPYLGVTCYFNTTKEGESQLFTKLNTSRVKLSPNVLLRNLRESNPLVQMLYELCDDSSFVLYKRVAWQQQMQRKELFTALGLLKVTGQLHATFGPGSSGRWQDASGSLYRTMRDIVGRKTMRDNLKLFWDVIDDAWGVKNIAYKAGACYIKNTFLISLCMVFANHQNFWDDNRKFSVLPDIRRKLSSFPIQDRHVQQLSSSGSVAASLLYGLMVDHINSGKRTHRLIPFKLVKDTGVHRKTRGKQVLKDEAKTTTKTTAKANGSVERHAEATA